jgi:hypothetical protein
MASFVLNIDENSKLGKSVLKFLKEMEGKELTIEELEKYMEKYEDAVLGEMMLREGTDEYVKEEEVLKKLKD